MSESSPAYDRDLEHLRLLRIFYYVYAGISAFFACIPIIHFILGLVMLLAPDIFGPSKDQPPRAVGLLFMVLGGGLILLGWTLAALVGFTGKFLGQRTHYTFCLVIGCLICISLPFGTVLGVFTIIVLNRPSVKAMFGKPAPLM